jgi:alkanesulfonate monooxygenase SsuD/methylene tetrahydromethanopterin reductase-like flavin-dependent oxidoreductase (luciferase family)
MPSTADADSFPLGLSVAPSKTISIADLTNLAELAEGLGYHSIWLPETWGPDAASLLAALAGRTERILLASGVFNVFSRSAALLAQTAATLQNLSGGRFILGLGASGPGVVEQWHGVPFDHPVERTQEYVEVVRLALSGKRVDYEGAIGHVSGFRLAVHPVQPVPIYVAALGPRNVRMTGAVADGWLPIFAPRGHMEALFRELQTGARLAGRQSTDVRCAAYLPCVVGVRAERLLRQQLAYYIGGMGSYYYRFAHRVGLADAATAIRDRWQSGDRIGAVSAVQDPLLELCTLGTDASTARSRIAEYRDQGIDLPVLALPNGCTREEAIDTIRALAPGQPDGPARKVPI